MGWHQYAEGASVCREVGAALPLPKNDEELDSFKTGFGFAMSGTGLLIDATDLDEDDVWEDSYGNEVTYFPPLWYYLGGEQKYSSVWGIQENYQYMAVRPKTTVNDPPEIDGHFLAYVTPNVGRLQVYCQIPLDPPTPTVNVPPTPVQG